MDRSGRIRRQSGAVMVGPDGQVYFVPERVQPAFRAPVLPGLPGAAEASASTRIRKRVEENQAYLPQMPAGLC